MHNPNPYHPLHDYWIRHTRPDCSSKGTSLRFQAATSKRYMIQKGHIHAHIPPMTTNRMVLRWVASESCFARAHFHFHSARMYNV